jgi:predicted hotdog family 3-hydroxylacyl-ACP dehydratase
MTALGHDDLATLIPHSGSMCLLDGVLTGDANSICCLSARHLRADNPLRGTDGTLGTICGLEFAAQAIAVHARLMRKDDGGPRNGYLASVRNLRARGRYLDRIHASLIVEACRRMSDEKGAIYSFLLASAGEELLSGRVTLLLASHFT